MRRSRWCAGPKASSTKPSRRHASTRFTHAGDLPIAAAICRWLAPCACAAAMSSAASRSAFSPRAIEAFALDRSSATDVVGVMNNVSIISQRCLAPTFQTKISRENCGTATGPVSLARLVQAALGRTSTLTNQRPSHIPLCVVSPAAECRSAELTIANRVLCAFAYGANFQRQRVAAINM